eukprot:6483295-Amphidinium_carterae.3
MAGNVVQSVAAGGDIFNSNYVAQLGDVQSFLPDEADQEDILVKMEESGHGLRGRGAKEKEKEKAETETSENPTPEKAARWFDRERTIAATLRVQHSWTEKMHAALAEVHRNLLADELLAVRVPGKVAFELAIAKSRRIAIARVLALSADNDTPSMELTGEEMEKGRMLTSASENQSEVDICLHQHQVVRPVRVTARGAERVALGQGPPCRGFASLVMLLALKFEYEKLLSIETREDTLTKLKACNHWKDILGGFRFFWYCFGSKFGIVGSFNHIENLTKEWKAGKDAVTELCTLAKNAAKELVSAVQAAKKCTKQE